MKKFVCIFLLTWLPLFISAASAASLQMTLANLNADASESMAQESLTNVPPCHQPLKNTQEKSHPKHDTTHHVCAVCGFCVIAGGFANISHNISVEPSSFTATPPAFFAVVFHSQTYPPAIRPPIFN